MTAYHARHIGSRATAEALVAQGWQVIREYQPLSPVIDYAGWLRCPATCCPPTCPDCGAVLLACRCAPGEGG